MTQDDAPDEDKKWYEGQGDRIVKIEDFIKDPQRYLDVAKRSDNVAILMDEKTAFILQNAESYFRLSDRCMNAEFAAGKMDPTFAKLWEQQNADLVSGEIKSQLYSHKKKLDS